jgi:ketosteroid isomerase-like protein
MTTVAHQRLPGQLHAMVCRQERPRPVAHLLVVGAGLASLLVLAACRPDPGPAVRAVLDRQAAAWNGGDLDGFMDGYWRSDQTRFASGGDVSVGWQTVLDRYRRRYRDRATMGTLIFSEIQVTPLARDSALAYGRWRLQRAHDAPSGLFTLIFRKTPDGWRIVYDHTSAAADK